MTVIVVANGTLDAVRPTIVCMKGQHMATGIQVLVVAPEGADGRALDGSGLHSLEMVTVPRVENRGVAAAAAVPHAQAPVVALTENHCFAEPEWAEVILAAYEDPDVVGVGGAILNANPETTLSRAMHAAGYGRYAPTDPAGERDGLPLHNSSYRRAELLRRGQDLELLMADERRLQSALLSGGGVFRFEPTARKHHINEATWPLLLSVAYDLGRGYATGRSAGWPLPKRLLYALLVPVLSLPILRNVWGYIPEDTREGGEGPPLLGVTWVWALAHSVGEGATYLLGGRTRFPRLEQDEFLIEERLGGHPVRNAWVAGLLESQRVTGRVAART